MRKGFYIYIFAGLAVFFSLALVPNQALAISEGSSTLSTSYGGRTDTDHQLSFKLGATLVAEGRIGIIFPTSFQFDVPGTEDVIASGSMTVSSGTIATATLDVGANDQTLTLWYAASGGVPGLSTDTIHLTGLAMAYPASGGSHTLGINTIGTDALVDEEASSTAFSITAVNAEESQTQTSSVTVTPPSSKVTSPTAGQAIAADQDYTIKGTAADLGLYAVSKVEVSVDGGSTWNTADLTKVSNSNFTWEYVWTNPTQGTYSVRTRATDTAGNVEELKTGISFTVSAAAPASTPTPAAPGTIQSLQLQVVSLQQQVVALLQQLLQLLQSSL